MNDIAMTTKEKDYPYYCRICGEAIADSEATHDRVCPMCENELALNYIGYAIGSLMTRHKRIETDRKLDRELAKSKP